MKENPSSIGLIFVAFGIMLIVGAVRDWNWIFGNVSSATYDLKKLDGIINWFGRKTGRIFGGFIGVFFIIFGMLMFLLF